MSKNQINELKKLAQLVAEGSQCLRRMGVYEEVERDVKILLGNGLSTNHISEADYRAMRNRLVNAIGALGYLDLVRKYRG